MPTSSELDMELGVVRRLVSRTESEVRRVAWRRAMQRRATRIFRVVHAMKNATISDCVTAAKRGGAWRVFANGVYAITIATATPAKTLDDLCAPLRVRIHRDVVREDVLNALVADGSIIIEATP